MKRMWATDLGEGASFSVDHYQNAGAYFTPGPIQDPHPPILVGGTGEEVTLKLVAKLADIWNMDVFNGDADTLEHKIDDLLELMTTIQFEQEYTDQPDITRVNAHECFIMGTPEECAEQIQARIDAGITKFMCWFVDFPDTGGLFADEVVPHFQ